MFSKWLGNQLNWVKDSDGNSIFASGEDPETRGSVFDEHRMNVIRTSITTNLIKALANYNSYALSYEYELPQISETDWDLLLNNVSIIAFLQGMPIGSKYFNDYCVINNNKTEEMVNKESIYLLYNNEFHRIGCSSLVENSSSVELSGYFNLNYEKQVIKKNTGETEYFYPRGETGCYYCTVKSESYYNPDDLIKGNDIVAKDGVTYTKDDYSRLRKAYLTTLAREKMDLYKSNSF